MNLYELCTKILERIESLEKEIAEMKSELSRGYKAFPEEDNFEDWYDDSEECEEDEWEEGDDWYTCNDPDCACHKEV